MEFKNQIEAVLKELKKFKLSRREVEKQIGYKENSLDQQLSRGGSSKILRVLELLLETKVLQKAIDDLRQESLVTEDSLPTYSNPNYLIDRISDLEKAKADRDKTIANQERLIEEYKRLLDNKGNSNGRTTAA
jgi:hypothetical protein